MYFSNNYRIGLMFILAALAAACAENDNVDALDTSVEPPIDRASLPGARLAPDRIAPERMEAVYQLSSEKARGLVGEKGILHRVNRIEPSEYEFNKIRFATYSDDVVAGRLNKHVGRLLQAKEEDVSVTSDDIGFYANTKNGSAWCAKKSGACSVKRHGRKGATRIANRDEAVDLALKAVADNELLTLADGESLDVTSVTATVYGGVSVEDGKMTPVEYQLEDGTVTEEFVSEYTVTFGRRINDVPVIGPGVTAKLDADGELMGFTKRWRDIASVDEVVPLASDKEILERRDENLMRYGKLTSIRCGYFEDGAIGIEQDAPGVGCKYNYTDGSAAEKSAAPSSSASEIVNIMKNNSFAFKGRRFVGANAVGKARL